MLITLLLATPLANAVETSFTLAGFGQSSLAVGLRDGDVAFEGIGFSPIFAWREGERVLAEAELEFNDSADGLDVGLEYASVSLDTGGPVVTVGKFLSPTGHFMVRLHPSWINKLTDFPLPYRVGPLPMNHVGVQAQQVFTPSFVDRIALIGWVDNGPSGADGAPSVAAQIGDNNRGKGVGGRLAVMPVPQIELAASTYTGAYTNAGDERYLYTGADGSWTHHNWLDLRGEYIRARWTGGLFQGAWAQAAWRLHQVHALARFEPVARFGWAAGDSVELAVGEEEGHGHGGGGSLNGVPLYEVCGGLNTYLRSNVVIKGSFTHQVESYDPTVRVAVAVGF